MQPTTIGLDLAKSVFQVHGVDQAGKVVIKRQLRRAEVLAFFGKLDPCLVGIEACATAHHWAREIEQLGHAVRLMPPAYVKAYVRRQKNDAADAAAICEAVARPSMRFVPVKTVAQQAALSVHRTRDLLIRQRTQLINALRAHLAEVGLVAAKGTDGIKALLSAFAEAAEARRLPLALVTALGVLVSQLRALAEQIGTLEQAIMAQHKASPTSRRLETIPGVGVIGATATVATVTDPKAFRSGREYSAWVGLVPRQHSTGGKERLGGISKQGDRTLRRLYILGATAVIRHTRAHPGKRPWLDAMLARKPAKVVAVALANKIARTVWALLVKGGTWRPPVSAIAGEAQPGAAT